MKDLNVLNLESILEKLAGESERILAAGIEGDEITVRACMDRIRQLNSDIKDIDAKYKAYFDSQPKAKRAKISELLSIYKKSEDYRNAWRQRYHAIGPIKLLIDLPDGPDGILDMIIPEAWDWNLDIMVLSSRSDRRIISSLVTRGQKRILVFCTSPLADELKIDDVVYLEEANQIDPYFVGLMPNIPSRIFVVDVLVEIDGEIEETELKIRKEYIEKIQKTYQQLQVNRNTTNIFGSRWVTQGVENLPIIASQPSIKHFSQFVKGLPLVIISPGPSLDKNIHQLKQIQDRAILVAPAQTIRALQKAGITPDIVMVVDPQDYSNFFEGYDMSGVKALLIGVSCFPLTLQKHKDKVISTAVNGPLDSWICDIFNDDYVRGGGGSVSTLAFTIAGQLQCNPIILVGQDLAFANGKQYSDNAADGHFRIVVNEDKKTYKYKNENNLMVGTIGDSLSEIENWDLSTLPGFYGDLVQTKADYAMFHAEFERWAKEFLKLESAPRLFNCTEGGAFIEGFEHISLKSAARELRKIILKPLNKHLVFEQFFNSTDKKSRLKKLRRALADINSALNGSLSLALKCDKLANKIDKGKAQIAELSEVERELIKEIKASNFISIAIQEEIRKTLKLSVANDTLKQNLAASKLLYKLIIDESKKIQPPLATSIAAVEQLLRELGFQDGESD
jgi:hypothetical protein